MESILLDIHPLIAIRWFDWQGTTIAMRFVRPGSEKDRRIVRLVGVDIDERDLQEGTFDHADRVRVRQSAVGLHLEFWLNESLIGSLKLVSFTVENATVA
jgi:hypothetical protein